MTDQAEIRLRKGAAVLQVDALTGTVVDAMTRAGVQPVLLKGPTVARWLYAEIGDRQYTDTDLLVDPAARNPAEAVLRGLGFSRGQSGWLSKSREWRSERGLVDLHTSLFGIELDDREAWALLAADTGRIVVGGVSVAVLGPAARAFHIATHAAQHDTSFNKPVGDLERALAVVPLDQWRQAAALAERLGAVGTFVAGLRKVGAGELLAQLGLADTRPTASAALLAGDAPPTALGFSQLAEARTLRVRMSVLGRGVMPRATYMQRHYPVARRGRAGLVWAYVARVWRLARHIPAGVRAWRGAGRAG